MALPPARYIVLHHDGAWKINLDNRYFGPFVTQDAAVAMATDTARKASKGGYRASVLLMRGTDMDIIWSDIAPES